MAEQLIFDFPRRTAFGREDFFRSEANEMAVQSIEAWRNWPNGRLVLNGPKGAGKTHLAMIWTEKADALIVSAKDLSAADTVRRATGPVCVDDAHVLAGSKSAQTELFHLYNMLGAEKQSLMITGRGRVADWGDALPDLQSRLASVGAVSLGAPDDALIFAVLLKQFEDRQMQPDADIVNYLMPRIERSFGYVQDLAIALDQEAMRARKPINRNIVRRVLAKLSDAQAH